MTNRSTDVNLSLSLSLSLCLSSAQIQRVGAEHEATREGAEDPGGEQPQDVLNMRAGLIYAPTTNDYCTCKTHVLSRLHHLRRRRRPPPKKKRKRSLVRLLRLCVVVVFRVLRRPSSVPLVPVPRRGLALSWAKEHLVSLLLMHHDHPHSFFSKRNCVGLTERGASPVR